MVKAPTRYTFQDAAEFYCDHCHRFFQDFDYAPETADMSTSDGLGTGPMSYDEQEALEKAGFDPDQMTSAECADAYRAL